MGDGRLIGRFRTRPAAPRSIAAHAVGGDRLLGLGLIASSVLLVVGWTAPIMTVKRLFLFGDELSVLQGLFVLADHGDLGLLAILTLFTIVFPIAKLILAFRLWRHGDVTEPRFERHLRRVETLGRWSMLDVFLVSLTVAAVEGSLIADIHLHWGLYVFTAAVILSMITFSRMTMIAARMAKGIYP